MSELPGDTASPAAEPVPHTGAEAADSGAEAGEAEEEDRPYDSAADQAFRHKVLLRSLPGTLVAAAFGSYFGYLVAPKLGNAHISVTETFQGMGMALGGFGVFLGIFFSVLAVLPARRDGPKPAPKPRPMWLIVLIVIGCWLAAYPFSWIGLFLVGLGIDGAVGGAWVKAVITIAVGLLFSGAAAALVAGSGATARRKIKPGGEVPTSVRESAWWGRVLFLLLIWAVLMTVAVIAFGVQGDWGNFWDTVVVAIASWAGFFKASSSGEMPDDAFGL